VVSRGGRQVVFVVRDGVAIETQVQSGGKLGDQLEIKSGVRAGDKVVLAPPERLKDGTPVQSAKR